MRSIVRSSAKLFFVLLVAFVPVSATADYVFRAVEYPSPTVLTYNSLWGITSGGNAKLIGNVSFDGLNTRGFKYDASVTRGAGGGASRAFTLIPLPPGRTSMGALGINEAGVIVGSLEDGQTGSKAFVLEAGVYTVYTRPGWEATEFRSINDTGLITGWSWHIDPSTGYIGSPDGIIPASTGFIFNRATGVYTDFSVPGASVHALYITHGINNAGQAVGSANFYEVGTDPSTRPIRDIGFLRQPDGTISTIVVDGGSPHAISTKARGINDNGLIAGTTRDASNNDQVFVGNSSGFQVLSLPSLALPDAVAGFAEGIGHDGQIIGIWWDTAGRQRGFMATPAALPVGTSADGTFTFSVAVVPNTPIFIDPPVALAYDYAIGRKNPRFGTVRFPIGIGDSEYILVVGKKAYPLNGGQLFDFRTDAKKKKGVKSFRVACIDPAAGLDPVNSLAFPTEVSFVRAGMFTGSQKPLTEIRSRGHAITDRAQCMQVLLKNGGEMDDDDDEEDDD
jgi:hypothetical protein